jgi:hypothetical protein
MLRLNILPEEFKKEIKLFSVYSVSKNIVLLIVFLTAIVGIIFLLGDAVLQTYIHNSGVGSMIIQSNYQNLDEQVKEAETKIEYVVKIQEEAINWSRLMEDIMLKTGDNVVFSRIVINREKYQLELFGHAETRSDLIELKRGFESSSNYLTVDFPIENILEKNDIDFDMLITINSYDFR